MALRIETVEALVNMGFSGDLDGLEKFFRQEIAQPINTMEKIGEKIGISGQAVNVRMKKMGIPVAGRKREEGKVKVQAKVITKLIELGYIDEEITDPSEALKKFVVNHSDESNAIIGQKLGVSDVTAGVWRKKFHLPSSKAKGGGNGKGTTFSVGAALTRLGYRGSTKEQMRLFLTEEVVEGDSSVEDVAAMLNCNVQTINIWLKMLQLGGAKKKVTPPKDKKVSKKKVVSKSVKRRVAAQKKQHTAVMKPTTDIDQVLKVDEIGSQLGDKVIGAAQAITYNILLSARGKIDRELEALKGEKD